MIRTVAFLRAINVGGHRKIKMADLRAELEALGLTNVATYIASGNVVFDAAGGDRRHLEKRIEDRIAAAFGFDVPTFVRTAAELKAVAAARPFGDTSADEDANRYVAFLREPVPAEQAAELMTYASEVDLIHIEGPHVYWLRRNQGETVLSNALIEKALAVEATMRNDKTVQALVERFLTVAD